MQRYCWDRWPQFFRGRHRVLYELGKARRSNSPIEHILKSSARIALDIDGDVASATDLASHERIDSDSDRVAKRAHENAEFGGDVQVRVLDHRRAHRVRFTPDPIGEALPWNL